MRTSPAYPAMGLYGDLDRFRPMIQEVVHAHIAVNEAHKTLHTVQDGLNL
jgi:hypothetical protein